MLPYLSAFKSCAQENTFELIMGTDFVPVDDADSGTVFAMMGGFIDREGSHGVPELYDLRTLRFEILRTLHPRKPLPDGLRN